MKILKLIREHIAHSLADTQKGLAIYELLPIKDSGTLKDFKAGKIIKLRSEAFWKDILQVIDYQHHNKKLDLNKIQVPEGLFLEESAPILDEPKTPINPETPQGEKTAVVPEGLEALVVEQSRLMNEKKMRQRKLGELGDDNSEEALATAKPLIEEITAIEADIQKYQSQIDNYGLAEPEGDDLAELARKNANLQSVITKTKKAIERLEQAHKESPKHEKTLEDLQKYRSKYATLFQEQLMLKLKIEKVKLNQENA